MSSILTRDGKASVATFLMTNITHMAVGRGDWGDVDPPPSPTFEQTTLKDEIGRSPISTYAYLVEDPLGTIIHDEKTWSISDVPTNTIQLVAHIPSGMVVGEKIREMGFFGDGVDVDGGNYQPLANVRDQGHLFIVENLDGMLIGEDQTFTRKFRLTL